MNKGPLVTLTLQCVHCWYDSKAFPFKMNETCRILLPAGPTRWFVFFSMAPLFHPFTVVPWNP